MRPLVSLMISGHGPDRQSKNPNTAEPRLEGHKPWWKRYTHHENGAPFRRVGGRIEEELGDYGSRTLISANPFELKSIPEDHEGVFMESKITIT